jgi:hypothetical protein
MEESKSKKEKIPALEDEEAINANLEKRAVGRPKISEEIKKENVKALYGNVKTKLLPENMAVHARFNRVFDYLIESGALKNTAEFVKRYNLHYGNFLKVRNTPEKNALPIAYLVFLVEDYGVSANWLLTGRGEMLVDSSSTT